MDTKEVAMFFTIVMIYALAVTIPADSNIQQQCSEQGVSYDTVCACFGTLDAVYLIEQRYYADSSRYFTVNPMHHTIDVDSFLTLLDAPDLPPTSVNLSSFHIVVSFKLSGELPDTCTTLVVYIFDQSADNNMPMAQLTYYPSAKVFEYEYVNAPHQHVYCRRE